MARRVSEAGETPQRWFDRIDAFVEMHKRGLGGRGDEDERNALRKGVDGDFPPLIPGASEGTNPSGGADQLPINLCSRYVTRNQQLAFDESPEPRWPRDRRGAEKLAEGVDRLVAKETERAGLPMRFRDGIPLLATDGSFGLYYGVPTLPTAKQVQEMAKDAGTVLEESLAGAHTPVEGQDHAALGQALMKPVMNPLDVMDSPPEATMALGEAAALHAEQAEKEAEVGSHRPKRQGRIFFERLIVGHDLAWDAAVCSSAMDGRWMMRRVNISQDEAEMLDALTPSARRRLEASEPTREQESDQAEHGSETWREDQKVVELWEVWDRRYKRRHYIARGLDEYLEADDTYPYLDEQGEPVLEDFFPIEVVVVRKGAQNVPQATYGVPSLRDAWPVQLALIKVESYALQAVKRASVDKYLSDPRIAPTLNAWLMDGKPGVAKGVDGLDDQRKALVPVQFTAPLADLQAERERLITRFSIVANFPLSELTSQPVADTATQEEMALSQGNQGVSDLIKVCEYHYARILRGAFRVMVLAYSPESLGEVAGAQFVEAVTGVPMMDLAPEQQAMGLKAYAAILKDGPLKNEIPTVRFGATRLDDNPRRVEQLFKFLPLAVQAGLDAMPVVQEIGRALGIGDLQPIQMQPEGAGAPPEGGPPKTETGNEEPPARGPQSPSMGPVPVG